MAKQKKQMSLEEKEKNLLQSNILIGFVALIIITVLCICSGSYLRDYPRASFTQALSGGMDYLAHPRMLFPLQFNFPLWVSVVIIAELIVMVFYFLDKMKLHHDVHTIKGSSKWADIQDILNKYADFVDKKKKNYKDAFNNAIMSAKVYVSLNAGKHFHALNTLILGTTGSGKSRYFLKPNILQMNSSYVITDPKGELLDSLGQMLFKNGYRVRVFDILNMGKCDTYNPLKYCEKESDIKKIVQAFMKNTDTTGGKGGAAKDPFWDDAMNAFLCATIGLLVTKPKGSDKPYGMIPEAVGGYCYQPVFATICELTRMANKKWTPASIVQLIEGVRLGDGKNNTANASELSAVFENIRHYEAKLQDCSVEDIEKPYCLREWENFRIAPEKTSTTILMTAAVRLDPFNIEQVRNLTSSDTIGLETFGTTKDALFLIIPPTDRTYNFLVAFLYTQLFDILYKTGAEGSLGSKILKLRNSDLVRYFPKKEVDEGITDTVKKIKNAKLIFNEGNGQEKIEVEGKKGKTEKLVDDGYYDIVSEDNRLITRRPNRQQAEKFIAELQKARLVDGKNPKLPFHVRFLMDEFATTGEVPEFKDKLATVRGYEISCAVFCQSITQLKGMYPDDYEVIDANCPFTIFLGGDENTNNEYLSKKLGKSTVKGQSLSLDNKNKANTSVPVEERDLMKPEELGRMDYSQQLLLIYGEQPVLDDKIDYPALPNYWQTHDYACEIGLPHFNEFIRPDYANRKAVTIFRPIEATAIPNSFEFTPEAFMKYMCSKTIPEAIDDMQQSIERYQFSVASSNAVAF